MTTQTVSRWTGAFGLACIAFWVGQFPLWFVGTPTSVYDGAAFARHLHDIKNVALTRILFDQGIFVTMLVFAVGLRELIKRARIEYEWAGTLLVASAVVWLSVTLVADGMEGGAVLDTMKGTADPSAVRALVEGTLLIYNGSTAFAMTALFLAVAGFASFATGILPKWTGWMAYAGAALCVACIPAMYFGPADYAGFYNAGGWGPSIIANIPPLIWFVVASVQLLRKKEVGPRTQAGKRERLLQASE